MPADGYRWRWCHAIGSSAGPSGPHRLDTQPDSDESAWSASLISPITRGSTSVGRSLKDLQRWKWPAFIHPDDVERIVEKCGASLATDEPSCMKRTPYADGKYRWMLHYKVALRNQQGEIVKRYGSRVDIQDRKCAEESLRRSELYREEGQRLGNMASRTWEVQEEAADPSQKTG